jgi:hypothetical protein
MSDGGASLNALDLGGVLASVEALRTSDASLANASRSLDPVRLHYIEALTRRLHAAPPAVQTVLHAKLLVALKALSGGTDAEAVAGPLVPPLANEASDPPLVHPEPIEGLAPAPALRKPRPKAQPEAAPPAAPLSLLGQLNQHIQTASSQPDSVGSGSATKIFGHATPYLDLKSAIRFRETWARISAETEVDQAAHRAPENAGPLNAHNLVLRTLSLMRELSPDYLRRFMSHTESLLWLDQAHGQLKQPAGKAKTARLPKVPKATKAKH